jgi:hypothetical protein
LTALGMALDRGDYYKSRWRGGVAVIRRTTLGLGGGEVRRDKRRQPINGSCDLAEARQNLILPRSLLNKAGKAIVQSFRSKYYLI